MGLLTTAEIRRLSIVQREALVLHVSENQLMNRRDGGPTADKLIELKCLRLIEAGRSTTLTDRGRHAAAFILGEYADALVAAGCLEPDARPSEILLRLKAERRISSPPLGPAPTTPTALAVYLAEKWSRARP